MSQRSPKGEVTAATRQQWSNDPCGAVYGKDLEFATREFFDEVERQRYEDYGPWMREVMEFDKFRGKRLVEVGCGMGTDLLQFARGGARVTGVDVTPRSVEISRQHFRVYGMSADFALTDAERLPFDDETFDVFYSNGVLHHTPNTAEAIREAYRVLKTGGTAKVMLYYRPSWNYWFELGFRHGVLKGELFRGLSMDDIMSKYVEFNEGGGRPLVKAYNKAEVRNMFSMFSEIKIDVDQLTRGEIYFVGKLIPEGLFSKLRRSMGWNVIITARK